MQAAGFQRVSYTDELVSRCSCSFSKSGHRERVVVMLALVPAKGEHIGAVASPIGRENLLNPRRLNAVAAEAAVLVLSE